MRSVFSAGEIIFLIKRETLLLYNCMCSSVLSCTCDIMISIRWSTVHITQWQVMLTAVCSSTALTLSLSCLRAFLILSCVWPCDRVLRLCFSDFSWFERLLIFGKMLQWHNLQAASDPSAAFWIHTNACFRTYVCYRKTLSIYLTTWPWLLIINDLCKLPMMSQFQHNILLHIDSTLLSRLVWL